MKKEDFRCCVCNTKGQWENMDKHRLRPEGMNICLNCGFVSYPERYKTEAEIKDHYRKSYRQAPTVGNLYSGERKLHYHSFFLKPLLGEWTKAGLTNPVVGEIGSATGMFLSWLKSQVPGAQLHGTELTETYRKVCYYEHGIYLDEDFDFNKKYDLIVSYHVLEHQLDADLRLTEYAKCLNDNGVFYLSCPIWFRDANNGAMAGFEIEYYWHPDHINSWSEQHLEYVIAKAGLEVLYKNDNVYGNTYILRKTTKAATQPTWDVAANKLFVEKLWLQWNALKELNTALAIELNPNCPTAWIHHYELNRAKLDKDHEARDRFLEDAIKSCPNTADINIFVGDVYSRYEKFDLAIKHLNVALAKKPNAPTVIMAVANCYRMMASKEQDQVKKQELIKKSVDAGSFVRHTSMELRDKAISWVFHDLAQLDLPKKEQLKERVI
jgi:2-polyprenyl-3-methyl-5-hydroxy-6-metoxy-1,4-benzoquinol methylase